MLQSSIKPRTLLRLTTLFIQTPHSFHFHLNSQASPSSSTPPNPTTIINGSFIVDLFEVEMEPPHHRSDALLASLRDSIDALGRGFDVTDGTRLLYCKGRLKLSSASAAGEEEVKGRVVCVDEERRRDVVVSDEVVIEGVSVDVECRRTEREGEGSVKASPVCSFLEMSKNFNEMSGLSGSIPIGSFNAMFNFRGNWRADEVATKSLAMVGCFIPLYKLQLARLELTLVNDVKHAVPNAWVPALLGSFIVNFGTHIVASVTIGGRDVVYLRQHQSSSLSTSDIEKYVKDIGHQRFEESRNQSSAALMKHQDKDVIVILRRRGGDELEQDLAKWTETVETSPDVINMTFAPIVPLLDGVPGSKHLLRTIEL